MIRILIHDDNRSKISCLLILFFYNTLNGWHSTDPSRSVKYPSHSVQLQPQSISVTTILFVSIEEGSVQTVE